MTDGVELVISEVTTLGIIMRTGSNLTQTGMEPKSNWSNDLSDFKLNRSLGFYICEAEINDFSLNHRFCDFKLI